MNRLLRNFARVQLKLYTHPVNLHARSFCAVASLPTQSISVTQTDVNLIRDALIDALKPKEIVDQLDKYIIGQPEAKRAVAIALRNRWRRHRLSDDLKYEVIPKNILMVGPTGCGKTEIARRIAKLSQAPFIKVEATKFTEVGFHGKDVDQIIRDLLDISINMTKKKLKDDLKEQVANVVNDIILHSKLGDNADPRERESFLKLLKEGEMETDIIEVDVPLKPSSPEKGATISFDSNFTGDQLFRALNKSDKKSEKKRLTISEARPILEEIESEKLLENHDVIKEAIQSVEENGIVFIDEIDKLVSSSDYRGADASSEGVQRDLLPLIEGSAISTKHGNVNTDFILFIASGAFHSTKPSDLLAELQGRLPIRVTLKGLSQDDLYRILTEPVNNLIRQQREMLKAENVELEFTDEAIREVAKVAFETNKTVENIGARRLHTIIERIVEEISFDAPEKSGQKIVISAEYVQKRVADIIGNADLKKYIL